MKRKGRGVGFAGSVGAVGMFAGTRLGWLLSYVGLLSAGVSAEDRFGPEQIVAGQARSPLSVFAADLDGDGDLDVLSAAERDDEIAWYENGPPASAAYRDAGWNPASYFDSSRPVLGTTYGATVDLGGTTGHALAGLVGYCTSLSLNLGGGQVLLVDITDPDGELLGQPLVAGPLAAFDVPIPNDLALAGFELSTQALHIGGLQPFALSNALDLVVGDD